MIKNERQYRVTKAQLRAFEDAVRQAREGPCPQDVDTDIFAASQNAMLAQIDELQAELDEYESLRRGDVSRFVAENFGELPGILIKARIATGLTQKDLAERLGLKEQQIQRWEANDYETTTVETLKQVMVALGVETKGELFIPSNQLSPSTFVRNLITAGIPKTLLLKRIFPSHIAAGFSGNEIDQFALREVLGAASAVSRVFGPSLADLLNANPAPLKFAGMAATRFKLPSRANAGALDAYTIYAHYLATLVESCAPKIPSKQLPTEWHQFYHSLTTPGKPMTLEGLVNFLWEHNAIVLPLHDEGAFHGAVWKIRGRFVLLVKQKTALESRWLYDLLHETGHVSSGHITNDLALIEDQPISPDAKEEEEEEANNWAEDALFGGDSSTIEDACVSACRGRLQNLGRTLLEVAKTFNVNADCLANYMAFRLSQQGENWWGAAQNMQAKTNPFGIVKKILLTRINLHKLNPLDRDLLMRALMEE